ncbi:MAG: Mut7-C RNAse domain-containing protein [Candidatus Hadarchaeota archaeon]
MMKFITDGMLGKLARWLRLAGHDVVGARELPDEDDRTLLERARSDGRALLTSDVELDRRAKKFGVQSFLLKGNDVVAQLKELSRLSGQRIDVDLEKSRCTMCNGTLREVGPSQVGGMVPEKVAKANSRFWVCSGCGKVFWRGGHWKNIFRTLSEYEQE